MTCEQNSEEGLQFLLARGMRFLSTLHMGHSPGAHKDQSYASLLRVEHLSLFNFTATAD